MLVRQVITTRPPAALSAAVTYSNQNRAFAPVDVVVTSHSWPPWVDPNDFIPLQGGGYSTKLPDTANPGDAPRNFISYTEDDRLVLITYDHFFEGTLVNGGSGQVGDGVTPFWIPPGETYHNNNVDYLTTYSGSWEINIRLTYESGRTETIIDTYTVTGAAGITEQELYIGGVPTPQYADDWTHIADLYRDVFNDPQKEAAARAFAASAGDPPPADPATFSLNALPPTAPQELQDLATTVTTGQTAFGNLLSASEAIYNTQGEIPAVLNELNGYSAIAQGWDALKSSGNANLSRVATANAATLLRYMDQSRIAHNLRLATLLQAADVNWQRFEAYSQAMLSKSTNELISIQEWVS